jgi:hypothetical protein
MKGICYYVIYKEGVVDVPVIDCHFYQLHAKLYLKASSPVANFLVNLVVYCQTIKIGRIYRK